MKIAIIIPVVNPRLADGLILSIQQNTIQPDQIVIIDNVHDGVYNSLVSNNGYCYYKTSSFIGTNEAWKLGLGLVSPDIDIIGIYNDDLILNYLFFEKLLWIMNVECGPKCAVAIPSKQRYLNCLERIPPTSNRYYVPRVRRGYCMNIRKSFLNIMPGIPEGMRIYYGDNWIWETSKTLGYFWVKMPDNPVYHYQGYTAKSIPEKQIRTQRKREQRILIKELRRWRSQARTSQILSRQ